MVNFHKLPNEIVDLKALKDEVGRDTDLDGNKAALVRVKAQGFSEKTMLDFSCYTRGVEMIVQKHKNGEWWWYLGSNCQGSIVIKYMGEYEFKLPNKLDAKGVYELVLGMETATLVINVVPQTADIYVDGNKIGTGYGSAAISVGSEHRYKVTCADYIPEEDVVKSDKAEKIEKQIELRPNFGYITIKSEPSGADVYVDEIKVGTTPYLMKKIKLGRHTVEIRKYGYESQADMVIIKVDEVNKQFENVKLVEDKSVPQQTAVVRQQTAVPQQQTPPPVASNTNTSVNNNSSNGVFSVSSSKKVQFSKGNLQYQASTKTWRFAEHQWDVIGEANKNISSSYSGWIDLFGWGTSGYNGKNPWMISTTSTDYGNGERDIAGTNYDWGVNNTILNGGGKSW
ncbi:MAG: PEGA domain-containing protein, partial [Bacteroidales bacterium]|nr:PEGA domain-containing protein [Bacteroidales bacterium]